MSQRTGPLRRSGTVSAVVVIVYCLLFIVVVYRDHLDLWELRDLEEILGTL